ncbi:MAG: hypothetical protein ACTHK2_04615 [Dokdonella sp.]|uniref:hypothetical protein n=1 Tax=Dokdonella sp. TaxID=2291710 RepID=UPI003F8233AC
MTSMSTMRALSSSSPPISLLDGHTTSLTQNQRASGNEPNSQSMAMEGLVSNDRLPVDCEPSSAATGHHRRDTLDRFARVAEPSLIATIRELHRVREFNLRGAGDMTRRVKSVCRRAAGLTPLDTGADKKAKEAMADAAFKALQVGELAGLAMTVLPIASVALDAQASFEKAAKGTERMLAKLALQTPGAEFVASVSGFGALGLSQIIGEAGDLSNYAGPAKLWKRMGLGLISTGERQRCFTDAAKTIEAGYSPRRRSIMFVIGDSLLKKQGPYRDLYLRRKLYEQQKKPDGTKMLWHRRAQRYMEKRLLRDLWRAWRSEA